MYVYLCNGKMNILRLILTKRKKIMKKLMMIAAMMVAAVSANAQFEPGTWSIQPKIGGTMSKVSNMPNFHFGKIGNTNLDIDKSVYTGALIGAEFEYQVAQPFSVAAGLNFSMQGCKWGDYEYKNGDKSVKAKDLKIELNYLNIPIVANFYLFKGFAIKTGVQFGFLLSAKEKGTTVIKDGDRSAETKESLDIKDDCKKFDIAIPIGISYQVPTIPIYIDGRYNLGLSKVFQDELNDKSCKNQVFQITVGYKFAL